jgi:O-acetyl-ADP-ribose deacetylase (regulator of RNase III)
VTEPCLTLKNGATLRFLQGDITQQDTDAIVNAANSSLMGGGGVDGAIHRAGGPAILEECKAIRAKHGELPAGQAVATTGGKLRARYVIHTVGPVWHGGAQGEAETLMSCYRESLRRAEEMKVKRVAFPSISTGAFGYPVDKAAGVAVVAAANALESARHVREVRFVLFDRHTLTAYTQAAYSLASTYPNQYRYEPVRAEP